MGCLQPPLEFLLFSTEPTLESFELSRLNSVANLRAQLLDLLEHWMHAKLEARMARWVLKRRHMTAQREASIRLQPGLGHSLRRAVANDLAEPVRHALPAPACCPSAGLESPDRLLPPPHRLSLACTAVSRIAVEQLYLSSRKAQSLDEFRASGSLCADAHHHRSNDKPSNPRSNKRARCPCDRISFPFTFLPEQEAEFPPGANQVEWWRPSDPGSDPLSHCKPAENLERFESKHRFAVAQNLRLNSCPIVLHPQAPSFAWREASL